MVIPEEVKRLYADYQVKKKSLMIERDIKIKELIKEIEKVRNEYNKKIRELYEEFSEAYEEYKEKKWKFR